MCCTGQPSGPLRVTYTKSSSIKQEKPLIIKLNKASSVITKQSVIPTEKCKECGHSLMSVIIAGKERAQCTNSTCRKVVR